MNLKNLTSREKKILNILIVADEYLTAKELAEQIGVSKRTISRELSKLKKEVKKSNRVLKSKPSVGIFLTGDKEIIDNLRKKLSSFDSSIDYSPEGRKKYIIEQFLFVKRFQKSTALAHRLSVTKATISYDLNKVAEWFEKRGLQLTRKQGVGIELEGSEADFRKAIIDFLYEDIGEEKFLSLLRERIDNKVKSKPKENILQTKLDVLNFISFETSNKIEKGVKKILDDNQFQMVNSSYMGLIIHLALAIKRIQNGDKIEVSKKKLEKLKETKTFFKIRLRNLLESQLEVLDEDEEINLDKYEEQINQLDLSEEDKETKKTENPEETE